MIRFEDITKVYADGFQALKGVNLHVREGELLTLIGPSGCGKTTTMRMVNRLTEPTGGKILINGQNIADLDPIELRRNTGYVIQEIGLFPHMTIEQNIALVPRLKKENSAKAAQRVDELMELVGLEPEVYKGRTPNELSGGQQQRVGVIRALAADPDIILMDEPFSALDPISREQLQDDIIDLQKKIRKTIVFVTHDMDEAIKIADRIAIMREGEVIQLDTPENILRNPVDDFVRGFIGTKRIEDFNGTGIPVVTDLMNTTVVTVEEQKGLAEARYIMRQRSVDSLFVAHRDRSFQGVISIRDVQQHYKDANLTVADIMTTQDIHTLSPQDAITDVAEIFDNSTINAIPVVDDGKLTGVVTRSSMIRGLAKWEQED